MYKILVINNRKILQRTLDNATIPYNQANVDYQQYLKWVEEGNTPEEYNIEGI
jgi:hypothetical protein